MFRSNGWPQCDFNLYKHVLSLSLVLPLIYLSNGYYSLSHTLFARCQPTNTPPPQLQIRPKKSVRTTWLSHGISPTSVCASRPAWFSRAQRLLPRPSVWPSHFTYRCPSIGWAHTSRPMSTQWPEVAVVQYRLRICSAAANTSTVSCFSTHVLCRYWFRNSSSKLCAFWVSVFERVFYRLYNI